MKIPLLFVSLMVLSAACSRGGPVAPLPSPAASDQPPSPNPTTTVAPTIAASVVPPAAPAAAAPQPVTVREDAPLTAVQVSPPALSAEPQPEVPAPPAAPGPPPDVAMQGFAFSPAQLQVAAGSTVVWTNQDPAPHTVTAVDASLDSGLVGSGATFRRVFATPGTFLYLCTVHPNMRGQVLVTP